MQPKLPPIPVRIAVIAVVVLTVLYFGIRAVIGGNNGALTASGSIEAVVVNIAPELAGKVSNVLVEESQRVKANDPLLRLDPNLLAAQRAVSAANLNTAKAGAQTAQDALRTAKSQYQIALEAALTQDKKSRLQDWYSKDPKQFNQPSWYFTRAEQIQSAQDQIDSAMKNLEDAQARLVNVSQSLDKADFLKAEKRLLAARLSYLTNRDVNTRAQNSASANAPVGKYNSAHCGSNAGYRVKEKWLTNMVYTCAGDDNLANTSDALYNAAKKELDAAQKAYDNLLNTKAAADVLQARAEVSVAQELYYAALDYLRKLQTGEQSTSVVAAEGVLSQAKAAAEQAQKAVEQAQANLNLLDAQLAKLEIIAPMDGIILTRNVEPGEYVTPGATALTMADLNSITITVYVPENRIGEINLGGPADLTVDSFPDITFTAKVVHIASEAEFTPRNVQTVEGRSATVYAVKLKVSDPEGKLKIGMPADVTFK